MSLSTNQLWQRITAAGLASPMQCRAWASEIANGLSPSDAAVGQQAAAALVAQGKLTAFQADTLLRGSNQPLVLNGWRILEPVATAEHAAPDARAVWAEWWQATKSPTSPVHWLRWLSSEQLKNDTVATAQPSLPQLLRHSQVKSPLLQRVDAPEMVNGQLQLSVEPVSGKLLSSWCDGKRRPLAIVWRMLIDVTTSLAALHAAGLSHGRVTPDRVVVGDDGRCRLLRDPLCGLTMSVSSGAGSGMVAQRLPARLSDAHFMAPEFLAPTPVASPATDCYGLGAIAWLLLAGQPPFTARSPEGILTAHAQQPLDISILADQPEPVVRCLVHCLAKNPTSRFASATALLRAAEEVSRIVAQGKVSVVAPAPVVAAAKPVASSDTAASSPQAKPKPAVSATPEFVKAEVRVAPTVAPAPAAVAQPVPSVPVPSVPVTANPVSATPTPTPTPTPVTAKTSAQEVVSRSPAVAQSAASNAPQTSVSPVVRRPVRRPVVKRKRTNPWLTPIIGGGGVVVLLLVLLLFRGGTGSNSVAKKPTPSPAGGNTSTPGASGTTSDNGPAAVPSGIEPVADPRGEMFELVESNTNTLWAPPRVPKPISLDMLPPGGQIFVALRPRDMLTGADQQTLMKLLEPDLQPMWQWIREHSGVEPPQISELVMATYSGASGAPQLAARIELAEPKAIGDLKTAWKNPTQAQQGNQTLWTSGATSYYIPAEAGASPSTLDRFSVGPTELMPDVAAAQGAAGPLPAALERLIQSTDRQSEVNLLIVPSFLFTDGRSLLNAAPPRAADIANNWLQREIRGASLSINLHGDGFYELRLIGASDRDATPNQQRLREALSKLPQQVESWFVEAVPHVYWRAVAMRYPNMLRALTTQTRTGVEAGQAIANGYLPAHALQNLVYASWMAVQPGATSGSESGGNATTAAVPALTAEQILERPISLVVDQQGIEVVLQLIGEQANEKLPPGTRPLKFELDGSGFQRAGFTRNQQVKNFQIAGQSVRAALTELARRQNPVPGVQDLKSAEQKMVWLLLNADNPEAAQVSLTSRDAATTAGLKLPSEFAP